MVTLIVRYTMAQSVLGKRDGFGDLESNLWQILYTTIKRFYFSLINDRDLSTFITEN